MGREQGNYWHIYPPDRNHTPQEIQTYRHTIQFPHLNPEQINMLEAPISTQNIAVPLSQQAKPKAPSPWNSTPLPRKHLSPNLRPRITPYLNWEYSLPPCSSPQTRQRPSLPRIVLSYILAKILAYRINTVLLSPIHPDQN